MSTASNVSGRDGNDIRGSLDLFRLGGRAALVTGRPAASEGPWPWRSQMLVQICRRGCCTSERPSERDREVGFGMCTACRRPVSARPSSRSRLGRSRQGHISRSRHTREQRRDDSARSCPRDHRPRLGGSHRFEPHHALLPCSSLRSCTRAARPRRQHHQYGVAQQLPGWLSRYLAYAASKHGLLGVYPRDGQRVVPVKSIRVNAIAPGYMSTQFTACASRRPSPVLGAMTARMPIGRWGVPEDLCWSGCLPLTWPPRPHATSPGLFCQSTADG